MILRKSVMYAAFTNGEKVLSGGFGGDLDLETANRLVKQHFTVEVQQSGSPTFVDKSGRKVTLYLQVNPASTDVGKAAIAEDRTKREAQQAANAEKESRLDDLLNSMGIDELLARLEK